MIYTTRVEECRDFYTFLRMNLRSEQHGTGPRHYAAELSDGTVFEIYPAPEGQETDRLRLGFTLTGVPGHGFCMTQTAAPRVCGGHDLRDSYGAANVRPALEHGRRPSNCTKGHHDCRCHSTWGGARLVVPLLLRFGNAMSTQRGHHMGGRIT